MRSNSSQNELPFGSLSNGARIGDFQTCSREQTSTPLFSQEFSKKIPDFSLLYDIFHWGQQTSLAGIYLLSSFQYSLCFGNLMGLSFSSAGMKSSSIAYFGWLSQYLECQTHENSSSSKVISREKLKRILGLMIS